MESYQPPGRLIVVGGSAGAIEAVRVIVAGLPTDIDAAICVVIHVPASSPSVLPRILERAGKLPAGHVRDGERIHAGNVYVAPPDRHLVVRDHTLQLTLGPKHHRNRPAVDPLFSSAAMTYQQRAIGVLLSGYLDDGSEGLADIQQAGGITIVQDPAEAAFPSMPESALQVVRIDHVLPISEIAPTLVELCRASPKARTVAFPETEKAETASGFICPDCGGALWESNNGNVLKYRCRVGHTYGADTLFVAMTDQTEAAMWTAVRALEEKAEMARRLAERMGKHGPAAAEARYRRSADATEEHAAVLREILRSKVRSESDSTTITSSSDQ